MTSAETAIVVVATALMVILGFSWLWERWRDDNEVETTIKVRTHADENWKIPTRAYDGDAGWDLYCAENRRIASGTYVEVACGFDIELPDHSWALLHSRSSTLRERGLMVNSAVFDSGYRGPVFVGVWNLSDRTKEIKVGERLAQLIPIGHTPIDRVVRVESLNPSERGENGFGSSGR